MLPRIVLVACVSVLLAAGCGGASPRPQAQPPKLPHVLAQQWAREAAAVAVAVDAGEGCHAQDLAGTLSQQVAARSGRVPARLRTPLLASLTALAGQIKCVQVEQPKGPPGPKKHGPKDHGPKKHGPGDGQGDQGGGG